MCGRFTLRTPASELAEFFDLDEVIELEPRYNIAPTQPIAVVRFDPASGRRRMAMLRWGLIPSWAEDRSIGNRLINARSETAATKPAFRTALRRRRCLIPADGFYEWQARGKQKQPFHIRLAGERPFAFAGLWERWQREGESIDSCTILTTDAAQEIASLHDRMPVVVAPRDYARWLDPAIERPADLEPLLHPYEEEPFEASPVSKRVNNPRYDGPECLAAVDADGANG